jgi:hypothetical protein
MDLYRQTVNSKMLNNETFEDFCTRVVAGNNLLEGDALHLSHANLRKTIEGHMSQYLADAIAVLSPEEHQKITDLEDFYEWEAEILRVDRRIRSHVSYVQDMNNSSKRNADADHNTSSKRQCFPDHFTPSPNPATRANAISNKENDRARTQSSFRTPCPKLTDDERNLLNQYSGCRKCRQLFINHKAGNCPNGFPDGKSYRTITREYALALAAKKAIAATHNEHPFSNDQSSSSSSVASMTPFSPAVAATMPFNLNSNTFDLFCLPPCK